MPPSVFLKWAQANMANGWPVLPVGRKLSNGNKGPHRKGLHGYTARNAGLTELERMAHSIQRQLEHDPTIGLLSLGVRMPVGVLVWDVDAYAGKNGAASLDKLARQFGPLPATWISTARDGGVSGCRFYRVPVGFYPKEAANSGIEFIDPHHRYVVVWPSFHHTGKQYRLYLPDGTPSTTGVLPRVPELPWLPASYVKGLAACATGAGRGDASAAEVEEFASRYAAGPQADMVPVAIRHCWRRNRPSVRNACRDALCWVAKEAKGGRYAFENAVEQIQLWAIAEYAKAGRELDLNQFDRLVAYAVGQASQLEEAGLRAKWDRRAALSLKAGAER
jgi:hypothetical protein